MPIRDRLAAELAAAVSGLAADGTLSPTEPPSIHLDVPPSPEVGDFSTPLPQLLARGTGYSPEQVARLLVERLELPPDLEARVEPTAAGFLNFRLPPGWLLGVLRRIRDERERFGTSTRLGMDRRALLEYVSAQPTGPITVAHGRGAALGDSLARMFRATGHQVTREYYLNDAGIHADRFRRTVAALQARLRGEPAALPLDGYPPEFAGRIAAALDGPADLDAVCRAVRAEHERSLAAFRVVFDEWRQESVLVREGLPSLLTELEGRGTVERRGNALWLLSRGLGDDSDRVLVRGDGSHSYLAGDLVYHRSKFERGFDLVIDLWAADHSGYIQRTRAGLAALGCDLSRLEILIYQPVSLMLDGMLVESSAPSGNTNLLDEVLERVGAAAARLLYLQRPASAALTLDLDLAVQSTPANPAHRIFGALALLPAAWGASLPDGPLSPAADSLLRRLADFPDEVVAAAREREPSRLYRYITRLVDAAEVVQAEAEGAAKTAVLAGTAQVLRNALGLLGAEPQTEGTH